MNRTKLCATRRHLVGYIERGSVIFYQQKSDATVPPLSRGRPGHLSYFYGYRIQFITLMSHCATMFISHFIFILLRYSFIVFCCGSLFSKEQANSLCIVASLGQPCSLRHFADESYKIRHIWPYFSVRIIYKDIWRCVHQHYNDCDIDEEDNCRLVIFSGALIDECEKEKHSILLFLHIQPLGLLSRCIFV